MRSPLTASAPVPAAGTRLPAADAFFLHADSSAALQQIGGVVLLDAGGGAPAPPAVAAVVRDRLAALPRFRQRLSEGSRWRRPRWVDAGPPDLTWHVIGRDLPPVGGAAAGWSGGRTALHRLVAELQATRLPRDRPLWRLVIVPEIHPGTAAAVLVVHHAVADGMGVIQQVLRLLDPTAGGEPAVRGLPVRGAAVRRDAVGRVARTGLAAALGVVQLAADGWVRRLPSSAGLERRFSTVDLPLAQLRAAAQRHGARVTDVLLSAVAGALPRVRPDLAGGHRPRLRTLVPLMTRTPASPAEANLSAAVMVDLPVGRMPEPDRLAQVVRRASRLRTGTRAVASRFVVQAVGEVLPLPVQRWFVRTVYSGRFFHAIVSNLPGPDPPLSLAGRPLRAAYPIIALAPGSPLAVGALGWRGVLHVGISVDPALLDDADAFGAALRTVVEELAG